MATRRRRVVWTEQARVALDEALAHVAQDSPRAARRLLDIALWTAADLEDLGERGRIVPELARATLHEVCIHPYRLLDEVADSEVRVLAFLHMRPEH